MSAGLLAKYGLEPVASVAIVDERFEINFSIIEARRLEACIYAFLVGEQIVRIGSCKGILAGRMNEWQRDVSAALQGKRFRTPKNEAAHWRELLPAGVVGSVWARAGTLVDTPVGRLNVYLAEESALIGRHLPLLNHSKHR